MAASPSQRGITTTTLQELGERRIERQLESLATSRSKRGSKSQHFVGVMGKEDLTEVKAMSHEKQKACF